MPRPLLWIFLSTPSARRATRGGMAAAQRLLFLSTPSARRATELYRIPASCTGYFYPRPPRGGRQILTLLQRFRPFISIHALREEGDLCPQQSRPQPWISIHALREEGDFFRDGVILSLHIFLSTPSARRATKRPGGRAGQREFLSTPSARRATAKTETKSLFSNKLYNILHEFRRALIYNGSKNYPNHAK